ncbi:formimidoylglutamate deiminase [Granulicella mallensis]|uniref:Formimidoylglutamate deiminase n=1 Tax=Granulicella mallensis TaxID=940614 RepID=A0A7W8ECD8_9BACT|nr:formimidoylglutamate deiminase [Granulicella mallensis]MBB5066559.1 formimidoylglutamate deiminase [Granulicella mallensis]
MTTRYNPALLFDSGTFKSGLSLCVGSNGKIDTATAVDRSPLAVVELKNKAVLPGFVNVHSHAFQRLIRGKSESRVTSGKDFWSWRGTMYHAAASLSPQDVYDVARMAFLEMVKAGTTTVGEFHYLHTAPDGTPYEDPNLLGRQVIDAARSVGIRIVLLRSAYLRSGFELSPDPGQTRFFETASDFCRNAEALIGTYSHDPHGVRFGIAPHSVRAVPLDALHPIVAWARSKDLPVHMHVAEQLAENAACVREYGRTPLALLHDEKLLGPDFTAVHAIHITDEEIAMLAEAQGTICSCPTTERNLGDGILAADSAMRAGIRIALGSDSQAQIDPLEDARQLDYHLRLMQQQRAILDQIGGQSLSARLFACATVNGARSLGLDSGSFTQDSSADFVTVDLNDLSIAGHTGEDLLQILMFGLNRSAIKDVFVSGKQILRDGKHALEEEIVARYQEVHRRVWKDTLGFGVAR